jgi:Transcriptional regulatory protein, C terminal
MIYRFADCALDTQLYTLERGGQRTRLPPKVFEVLCYLIEHRDHVVSKQELCDQVWEGLSVYRGWEKRGQSEKVGGKVRYLQGEYRLGNFRQYQGGDILSEIPMLQWG